MSRRDPVTRCVVTDGLDLDAADDEAASRVSWIRRHRSALGRVPGPGAGSTVRRLRTLAEIAAVDGSLGRLAEGHLDALAIIDELGQVGPYGGPFDRDHGVWGVWAARPSELRATRTPDGWRLIGTKPWCSGADLIDGALLTAVDIDGAARLFVVDVDALSFADDWRPLGMRATASCTATVDLEVDADRELGPPGGYVGRPGFWHGGIGVAACWHGLASRIVDDLVDEARTTDDPFARAAAGRSQADLAGSRALLAAAARQIDDDPTDEAGGRRLAGLVRVAVEAASRAIVERSITAQGAAALCFQPAHARAVADLTVYLRQMHPVRAAAAVDLIPPGDDVGVDWWLA